MFRKNTSAPSSGSASHLLSLVIFFDPEDGEDIFLRNVDFRRTTRHDILDDRTLHWVEKPEEGSGDNPMWGIKPPFASRNLITPRRQRIICVPADIRTGNLLNSSQKRYRFVWLTRLTRWPLSDEFQRTDKLSRDPVIAHEEGYGLHRKECREFRHLYLRNENGYDGLLCNVLFINWNSSFRRSGKVVRCETFPHESHLLLSIHSIYLLPGALSHDLCNICNCYSDPCIEFSQRNRSLAVHMVSHIALKEKIQRGGHVIVLLLPIHRPGKFTFKQSRTMWTKWTDASSNWRTRLLLFCRTA
jgi:hypothetical protein